MTDTRKLNRLLATSRVEADGELGTLAGIYEKALLAVAADVAERFNALTAATWQPQPEGSLLHGLSVLAAAIVETQQKVQARILKVIVGEPLDRLGIAWDVTHPLSEDLLAKAAMRTGERLGEAVQPLLREVVASAYEQGLSVPDTAALIREKLTEATPWQAEMLARTDLNGLSNGGSVIAAKLVGVTYKTWVATLDDRTRPEHAEADGQTVPIDAPFDIGGEQLEFPGDPAGSDAEVANCRCTVTYGDSLDDTALLADGGSIMGAMTADALTAATLAQTKWVSDLAFEGEETSDGRYFLAGCWSWREVPLTLMAQTVTAPGHDGAFVAGRIDKLGKRSVNIDGEPLADGVKAVRGAGVFDMGGEGGADIARLVADGTLRGVSVDYAVSEWVFRDPKTGDLIEPDEATTDDLERAMMGELQFAARKAEILAATVCPTPAFASTRIALTAAAEGERVYTMWAPIKLDDTSPIVVRVGTDELAAMTAAAAPAAPPREWFETQEPPGKMPLTITPEGRVFGHIATWDTCHTGIAQVCTTPPRSSAGYAYFHAGELETAEGDKIAVGKLMLASKGGKHAPLSASRAEACQHYDDTSMVAAYLRATDGQHGIWVAGALNPRLSADRLRELRTLPPSGDWREVNGRLELVCALAVPVPGFPVPRAEAALLASADELSLSALVASSGSFDPEPIVVRALAAAGLVADDEADDARLRALVARAEGGIEGLVDLASR